MPGDASADGGKQLKALTHTVAAYRPHQEGEITDGGDMVKQEQTHALETTELQALNDFRKKTYADKLQKARRALADQQIKLKGMRSEKVKGRESIETRIFEVLKELGAELSAYHGGSLNGKDIKKVMNNATHVFEKVAVILKKGRRDNYILSEEALDAMCLHFREVFVLWDAAFLLARTVNPMEQDIETYQRYVLPAVQGNALIRCTITPKVHLMLKHLAWQMGKLRGD